MGAMPDGRKSGEPLSDVESPYHGTDKNGPTALLRSVARAVDHIMLTDGAILNVRLDPTQFKNSEAIERLASLIRGYFDMKGMQMQFNVVSSDTLRDAQKHPDRYQNLVVRVAGYCARFVTLDRTIQEDIIARLQHELS